MNFFADFIAQLPSIHLMILVISGIVNVLFAGAVAKDAGDLTKLGLKTHLVSGVTWAFATLIGGPLVAIGYWFIHHLKLNK